ncbi:MAG: hypothetical protein NZ556_09380 [Fimbriimonadales bacterium]|nr:hypothetical protein [Fimbriimonadales bacterium]
MLCSVGVSPKQSMAWTVVSKPECTDRTVRATCTGWKPVLQMHGQDCPCYLHELEARATDARARLSVLRRGVGETPTLRKPARILKQSLRDCLK